MSAQTALSKNDLRFLTLEDELYLLVTMQVRGS